MACQNLQPITEIQMVLGPPRKFPIRQSERLLESLSIHDSLKIHVREGKP